jgi:5-methylcytosine-specific restriction endonuclease McrA
MRQRKWAASKRDELFLWLGGYCVDCGTTKDLEFDVIEPVNSDHHRRYDWSWRMSFYRGQYRIGNLALRCTKCNSAKGNHTECPF